MNKGELTKAVAEAADMSQAEAGRAVDAVFDSIAGAVKSRDSVAIAGFGTFVAKTRGAREGRNPATSKVNRESDPNKRRVALRGAPFSIPATSIARHPRPRG